MQLTPRSVFICLFIGVGIGLALVTLLSFEPFRSTSAQTLRSHSVETASAATAASSTVSIPAAAPQVAPVLQDYIEITTSCGPHYEGACVNAREDATTSAPSIFQFRTGMVLAVSSTTVTDSTGRVWYKIEFNEWIRYADRMPKDLYVAADNVRFFRDIGAQYITSETASTTKRIVVDRKSQTLYAYDGDTVFMQSPVSTGLDLTPTPLGTFKIYEKTPTRYMQGPLPGISDQYYDLPGVPWDLYFTEDGGAIHGAYWHNEFGHQWSHGCVNLPLDVAQKLYEWADVGTPVYVLDQ